MFNKLWEKVGKERIKTHEAVKVFIQHIALC